VFLNAHRCLEEGVEPTSERAWLFKIAEHVVMYRRRTISRRARVEFPIDVSSLADLVVAPGREIPEELDGLPDALARIPEAQRRAIVLREWYGLSYREVAAELGLSASAAETLIFRARRRLAQELGGPAPTEKRRRPLGLASPLGALKWLVGGGTTLKALVGVTSVAVLAVGSTRVGPFVHPATLPAAAAPLRVPAMRRVAAPHHVVFRAPARAVAPGRAVRVRLARRPVHAAVSQAPAAVVADPVPVAAPQDPAPSATTDPGDSPAAAAPAQTAFAPDAPPPTADRLEAAVQSVPPAQPNTLPVPDVAVAQPPVADPGEPVGSPPQDQGQGTPGPSEMASFGQSQRSEHASPNAADPGSNAQGAGPQNGSPGNGDAIPEPATDGAPDLSQLPAAPGGGPPPQAQGDPAPRQAGSGQAGMGQPSPPTGPGNDNGHGNESGPHGQDASEVEAPVAV
jgi:RNA polymerase sigma factor (sigma-70 family)